MASFIVSVPLFKYILLTGVIIEWMSQLYWYIGGSSKRLKLVLDRSRILFKLNQEDIYQMQISQQKQAYHLYEGRDHT